MASYGQRRPSTLRLIVGVIIALVSVVTYLSRSTRNELTGKVQQVSLSTQDEVALGLQALPSLSRQYGGAANTPQARYVEEVGRRVVAQSAAAKSGYPFRFTLLSDRRTLNAFALPGGPVFITEALLSKLTDEAQLAGVLGHEIGHVVARHGAQQLAKAELTQGLVIATGVATDDSRKAQLAAVVGSLVTMKYGRDDELESDALGVRFMSEAGYDPTAMLDVMKVLQKASAGRAPAEFFSTHPSPENRLERLEQLIAARPHGGERGEDRWRARVLGARDEPEAAAQPPVVERPGTPAGLPPEAALTLELIDEGGPFPFDRDGIVFENREGLLPRKPRGYYREYTVKTPGERTRGARRIIAGENGERYYTGDHYETFTRLR
ncbi:MAG: M48 family metalloprotease [Myxococcota bacterium]